MQKIKNLRIVLLVKGDKNVLKKLFAWGVAFIMCLGFLTGCAKKASDFSEEEHIQRVTARIEKRFMTDEEKYTSFSVYPLYNENDELNYFLVEFEPYGFIYVLLRDEQLKGFSWLGASTSMYKISNLYGDEKWSPYTIDKTNSQPYPETDKCWQVDENGDKINYNKSPYYVTENQSKRKYLFPSEFESASAQYICASRSGETFVNLISSTEVDVFNGDLSKKQATMYISFIAKKQFDL